MYYIITIVLNNTMTVPVSLFVPDHKKNYYYFKNGYIYVCENGKQGVYYYDEGYYDNELYIFWTNDDNIVKYIIFTEFDTDTVTYSNTYVKRNDYPICNLSDIIDAS